jgi:alkylated DNA repair dioxygenase AlkB
MNGSADVSIEPLSIPDGELLFCRQVFAPEESMALFQRLYDDIAWQRHVIKIYGRSVAVPRLSAWYGDPAALYGYSGLRLKPLPWTPTLLEIREKVEALAGAPFNSVLLNLYRDGRDSVGWHSDAEPELGRNPVIASVSLGASRQFMLRHNKRRLQMALELDSGSVLIMAGSTQHHWRHQLPKSRQAVGPRINLTFRQIQGL